MKRKAAILLALALMASIVLVACSDNSTDNTGNQGSNQPDNSSNANNSGSSTDNNNTGDSSGGSDAAPADITVVLASVGNNLDPVVANATTTTVITNHVYDNLLAIDDNLDVVADMAASWTQPDNLTIEFTVKTGYKFHNGADVTMDDVVYSIERMHDIARMASFTEVLESVTADGDKLIIKITEPDSGYLRNFASIPIVCKDYCIEAGEGYANAPIGSGPFKVQSYTPGDRVAPVRQLIPGNLPALLHQRNNLLRISPRRRNIPKSVKRQTGHIMTIHNTLLSQ